MSYSHMPVYARCMTVVSTVWFSKNLPILTMFLVVQEQTGMGGYTASCVECPVSRGPFKSRRVNLS